MKYIFGFLTIAFLMVGCSGDTSSPKGTVAAFIEAMKKGDIDGVKKLVTKSDVSLIDLGLSFAKQMGNDSMGIEKMKQEFVEKSKNVTFTIKDEKIDGDKADVNVEIKDHDTTQTHPFKLIKEDGNWKISLLSTGLGMGGGSHGDMNNPNVNMADSIKKALEQLKTMNMDSLTKMNMDSLHGAMKEGLQKLKEMEKTDPEMAKKIQEALKKMGKQ